MEVELTRKQVAEIDQARNAYVQARDAFMIARDAEPQVEPDTAVVAAARTAWLMASNALDIAARDGLETWV